MELKEFITLALTSIIDGVKDAQKETSDGKEGEVNPSLMTHTSILHEQGRQISGNGKLVQSVKFDVAVTATEGTGTKGGIGIFMGAVNLGSQGESKASQATVSRIQFEVPISLPHK